MVEKKEEKKIINQEKKNQQKQHCLCRYTARKSKYGCGFFSVFVLHNKLAHCDVWHTNTVVLLTPSLYSTTYYLVAMTSCLPCHTVTLIHSIYSIHSLRIVLTLFAEWNGNVFDDQNRIHWCSFFYMIIIFFTWFDSDFFLIFFFSQAHYLQTFQFIISLSVDAWPFDSIYLKKIVHQIKWNKKRKYIQTTLFVLG